MVTKSVKYANSDEALMEIFGTSYINKFAISQWQKTWKDRERFPIKSFGGCIRQLEKMNIDPLFYQMGADGENKYVQFYNPEHAAFYKIASSLS